MTTPPMPIYEALSSSAQITQMNADQKREFSLMARTFLVCVLLLGCSGWAQEGVRAELARLQKERGLALTWYCLGIFTVRFADRADVREKGPPVAGRVENALLSPDAAEIAFPTSGIEYLEKPPLTIIKRDGTLLKQYAELADAHAHCWSHDGSKLVISARTAQTRPPEYHLFILDVSSGAVHQFGDPQSYVTSQCWSPDGTQIVYSANKAILEYNLSSGSSRLVGRGDYPTWSFDGQRIAFRQADGFYTIPPSGGAKQLLFKAKQARSQLWWSPDSRMVAYLNEGGTFLETLKVLDVGLLQLRIRRLSDGSEDWVYQAPNVPPIQLLDFVWLAPAVPESSKMPSLK